MKYKPPFRITDKIVAFIAGISEQIGRVSAIHSHTFTPRLRKENRIRTIHSSLAIEQNTLSLEQVTAVLNGKRVLGNPSEIQEVKNAYDAYDMILELDPLSVRDLLTAHRLMMKDLVSENGRFRSGAVGVFNDRELIHLAPPADLVPHQIDDLMQWYRTCEVHPLVKSAVFHYEFEFIHPFSDGNGRIGRMWHSLLLGQWKQLFFWLPVEELIRSEQQKYYQALGRADQSGDSTLFVEFMLEIIERTLASILVTDQVNDQVSDQVKKLLSVMGSEALTATELMRRLKLTHRPTFRKNYLNPALEDGLIERTVPDKPHSRNQKYRKK